MAEGGLEGDGLGERGAGAVRRLCRRDGGEHLPVRGARVVAPRGAGAYCSVPRNRGKNTTLLASMSVEGMGPSLAVEGATTATVFEACVEKALAPTLRPGQIVVMDNLSAHKGARGSGSSSKSEAASWCTCRPIPPT